MKSKGGAMGLCVPPSKTRVERPCASSSGGSTVWKTRVALPARADGKVMIAVRGLSRLDGERRGPERVARYSGTAHQGDRAHGGQMLAQQSRTLALRADPLDAERTLLEKG